MQADVTPTTQSSAQDIANWARLLNDPHPERQAKAAEEVASLISREPCPDDSLLRGICKQEDALTGLQRIIATGDEELAGLRRRHATASWPFLFRSNVVPPPLSSFSTPSPMFFRSRPLIHIAAGEGSVQRVRVLLIISQQHLDAAAFHLCGSAEEILVISMC